MNILTVVTHPRKESLTFAVAHRFIQGLQDAGHETEVLDLYRSGFDPVLIETDEPVWTAENQRFSPEVETEMERMKRHDALAFVFPLWWWNMPALLKGYIDRVWNYGFAYGSSRLPHQRVLWLTLAGAPIERFEKRRYDEMITYFFNVGLAEYCGIPHSDVELFYETIRGEPKHKARLLTRAYELGWHYAKPTFID